MSVTARHGRCWLLGKLKQKYSGWRLIEESWNFELTLAVHCVSKSARTFGFSLVALVIWILLANCMKFCDFVSKVGYYILVGLVIGTQITVCIFIKLGSLLTHDVCKKFVRSLTPCVLQTHDVWERFVGLVVRRPPWERKIPGSNPTCAGIFSGSSHTSDLKIGTPVATLPGAWRYRVSAWTGWPGVSVLWLSEVESLICNFYLSVAARKIVWVDPSGVPEIH